MLFDGATIILLNKCDLLRKQLSAGVQVKSYLGREEMMWRRWLNVRRCPLYEYILGTFANYVMDRYRSSRECWRKFAYTEI
jgi:acetyl-CoA acetyltransferase